MKMTSAIFDLNGTVISDEYVYGAAFRKVLRSLGKHTNAKYPHIGGIGVAENWPRLLHKYKIKTTKTPEILSNETQMAYLEMLEKIKLKKGFSDFVEELRGSGFKIALATSNDWWVVEKVFDELGIESIFDSVTTGEEVNFKKPSPEIFLIAAEKLGVNPSDCVVFEDSEAGVEAAHAAGMRVVGIARDKEHAKTLKDADTIFMKDYPKLNSVNIQDF